MKKILLLGLFVLTALAVLLMVSCAPAEEAAGEEPSALAGEAGRTYIDPASARNMDRARARIIQLNILIKEQRRIWSAGFINALRNQQISPIICDEDSDCTISGQLCVKNTMIDGDAYPWTTVCPTVTSDSCCAASGLSVNDPCVDDRQCSTGLCDNFDGNCLNSGSCCLTKKEIGALCRADRECTTNHCVGNTCAAPPVNLGQEMERLSAAELESILRIAERENPEETILVGGQRVSLETFLRSEALKSLQLSMKEVERITGATREVSDLGIGDYCDENKNILCRSYQICELNSPGYYTDGHCVLPSPSSCYTIPSSRSCRIDNECSPPTLCDSYYDSRDGDRSYQCVCPRASVIGSACLSDDVCSSGVCSFDARFNADGDPTTGNCTIPSWY